MMHTRRIQHLHDETLILPIHDHLKLHASQYNILQHSKVKNQLSLTTAATQQIFPQNPHTVTTSDIETNMRHIHTSIVSRYLATRSNNKIVRTPLPHICSSEEILPRLTRHTLAQPRTNNLPFLRSYVNKVDAKSLPSPL